MRSPSQAIFSILLMGAMIVSGIVLAPQDADACMHQMQRVSPKQNAIYAAEWRTERRHYRKAIQTMLKISPSLVNLVNTDDELSDDDYLAVFVLVNATIRSSGKWELSKDAGRVGKKQRVKQLAWASKAIELLEKSTTPDNLMLARAELRFAQGDRSLALLETFELLGQKGEIYNSRAYETFAKLQKEHKRLEGAGESLAFAKENKMYEMETPRPEYLVSGKGEQADYGMLAGANPVAAVKTSAIGLAKAPTPREKASKPTENAEEALAAKTGTPLVAANSK